MKKNLINDFGGTELLKEVINTFVERMYDDIMIGFFFSKIDKNRLKEKEFEFVANFLGVDISYSGEPIADVHKKHRIMGGQFSRRKQILKEVLEQYKINPEIINSIMEHTEGFRYIISGTRDSSCNVRQ